MTSDEWKQLEPQIVRAWTSGKVRNALRLIQRALDGGDDQIRARALVYRGSITEGREDWAAAKDDFIQAAGLFPVGSYTRYTAELSVGLAFENLRQQAGSIEWYRAALLTCAQAEEPFSGAAALSALLSIEPALSPSDAELARTVTVKSWKVLKLNGEPDLNDLAAATEILRQRASDPHAWTSRDDGAV
jgi:hypothetical protein